MVDVVSHSSNHCAPSKQRNCTLSTPPSIHCSSASGVVPLNKFRVTVRIKSLPTAELVADFFNPYVTRWMSPHGASASELSAPVAVNISAFTLSARPRVVTLPALKSPHKLITAFGLGVTAHCKSRRMVANACSTGVASSTAFVAASRTRSALKNTALTAISTMAATPPARIISISVNAEFWTAPAKRGGDGALDADHGRPRSPKRCRASLATAVQIILQSGFMSWLQTQTGVERLRIGQRAQLHRVIAALRGIFHFRREQLHRVLRPVLAGQCPAKVQRALGHGSALRAFIPVRRDQALVQNPVRHARGHALARGDLAREAGNVQRFHRHRNRDGQKHQRGQNFRESEG